MKETVELTHNNQDGEWLVAINKNNILFNKDGETRIYDLKPIKRYTHEGDYLFLYLDNEDFYQVKFELDNFLVIDLFDKEGEIINEIGSHVFGEE